MLLLIVKSILVIVEIGSAILLCGVILIQKSKQHGAGLAIGGGMGETLFGGQVTGVLTKFTVIVASVFLVNTALLTIAVNRRVSTSGVEVKADVPVVPKSGPAATPPQVAPGTLIPSGPVQPAPAPAAAVPVEAAAPEAAKPEAPKTAE